MAISTTISHTHRTPMAGPGGPWEPCPVCRGHRQLPPFMAIEAQTAGPRIRKSSGRIALDCFPEMGYNQAGR